MVPPPIVAAPDIFGWTAYYEAPGYLDRVSSEERELGVFLANEPGPRKAAQAVLEALQKTLRAYAERKGIDTKYVYPAFFQDDPQSAGQVGPDRTQFESLLDPGANTREIMTAIYNACYAKLFAYPNEENVLSLKGVIGDLYLTPAMLPTSEPVSPVAVFARQTGINDSYARALTDFAKQTIRAPKSPDIFVPALLSQYSSQRDAREYELSMAGRIFRESIQHPTASVGDLQLAGELIGANELEYFRDFVYAYTIKDLKEAHYETVEAALAQYKAQSLEEIEKRREVALVERHYKIESGRIALDGEGRPIVARVSVLSGKVEWRQIKREPTLAVPDKDLPIPWLTGSDWFTVDPACAWYHEVCRKRGFPVLTGISGTTMRMLCSYGLLGAPGGKPTDYLYALMSWMLPREDHSLYEILRGAQMVARSKGDPNPLRVDFTHSCRLNEREGKLKDLVDLCDVSGGRIEAYPHLAETLNQDFPGKFHPGTCLPTSCVPDQLSGLDDLFG